MAQLIVLESNVNKITRYLQKSIRVDLNQKMVFLAGPRQCGETTLVRALLQIETGDDPARYLTWDGLPHGAGIARPR